MKRIDEHLFLGEINLFNKDSFEITALDSDYREVVLKIVRKEELITDRAKEIAFEIESCGLLDKSNSKITSASSVFEPEFVAFRIIMGEVCNLRCRDCFVINDLMPQIKMSEAFLESILEKIFQYGEKRSLKYHLFGGEPLAMENLLKLAVKKIRTAYFKGKIKKPTITITSNGTLLNEDMAMFLAENEVGVGLSIDGPQETNDLIRGKGVYEKVMRAFRLLERYEVNRWFLITPYEDIVDLVPAFIDDLTSSFQLQSVTLNTPFSSNDIGWSVHGKVYADMLLSCYKVLRKKKYIS